ncbi:MAG TPA: YicC/YloC family endoribonuclease [Gammaproteobacteria bacterium]|nr:YicC/YloC family endoribonuclease [Gammaproteobacteria bacterium]
MIRSMTGFARVEKKHDFGTLTWELRSVNHRFLEMAVRLPEELRGIEQSVRDATTRVLSRGKLDCILRFKSEGAVGSDIQIDAAVVQSLLAASAQVAQLLHSQSELKALDILRWPGVIKEMERDFTPVESSALAQLQEGLQQLLAMRQREGERIKSLVLQRCEMISETVAKVRKRRPQVMSLIRDKIRQRLAELQVQVDQNRFEQELVMITQRMDVDEELDRLEAHLAEVRNVFTQDQPAGRRLDFLMQELNREANTLGSKSGDVETTQAAVDLKVLIEQMREQIQNIE